MHDRSLASRTTLRLMTIGLLIAVLSSLGNLRPAPVAGSPQAGETLYASPGSIRPGGTVHVVGGGYPDGESLSLWINTAPPRSLKLLRLVTRTHGFADDVTLPTDITPGSYLLSVRGSGGDLATAPLTVLTPLTLQVSPNTAHAGQSVDFTVTNLTPGSLRIDFGGTTVLGPLRVSGSSYSGSFIVPPGSASTVKAINLVSGNVVASATTPFTWQAPMPIINPPPVIDTLDLSTSGLAPGDTFTITGMLRDPPVGDLNLYVVEALWEDGDGNRFPISNQRGKLNLDGSFSVVSHLADLLGGDAGHARESDNILLVVRAPGGRDTFSTEALGTKQGQPLTVKVVDAQGDPIPDAIVDLRGDFKYQETTTAYDTPVEYNVQAGGGTTSIDLGSWNSGAENQISNFIESNGGDTSQQDPFSCPPSTFFGRTDQNGLFVVRGEGHFVALLRRAGAEGDRGAASPALDDQLLAAAQRLEPRSDRDAARRAQGQAQRDREATQRAYRKQQRGDPAIPGLTLAGPAELALWRGWVAEALLADPSAGMLVTTHAGQLYAVAPEAPPLAGLRIVRAGLWLGTLQRDRFEPSHSLALALRAAEAQQVLSLAPDDERLGRYLAGHPLPEPGPRGWVLIAVDGFPIGWGRRAGDVIKNAYPKGLRRREAGGRRQEERQ